MSLTHRGPIVRSLLDTDFYKITMGQLAFLRYPDVEVGFSLINRSRVPLANFVREMDLRRELDRARMLRVSSSELQYLREIKEYGDNLFSEEYLRFLQILELPPYTLRRVGDDYKLEFIGPWPSVMFWEIIALAIVNELYCRAQLKGMNTFEKAAIARTGTDRLNQKIEALARYPDIILSDFGTRRRFSAAWQERVVLTLKDQLPKQFRGTSNVFLAMKYGLLPIGTSAHELPMVVAALAFAKDQDEPDTEILRKAQNEVLSAWYDLYGHELSIALTDTFGSDFFFRTASSSVARDWKGTRQDSGNPFRYGANAIEWYKRHGANPKEKLIVFSDQLTVDLVTRLHSAFRGRIGHTFGIGTNLTNDLGPKPISIVVKAASANGRSTVKLSDNLAKAMGDTGEVERYKRAAGYTNDTSEECIS